MARSSRFTGLIVSRCFAQLPADESNELHAARLSHLADCLFIVLHKRLLAQDVLGVEVSHPAFDHFFDDVIRFAFFAGSFGLQGPFALNGGRIEIFLGGGLGVHRRDV